MGVGGAMGGAMGVGGAMGGRSYGSGRSNGREELWEGRRYAEEENAYKFQ